jgi:hypothetical protein
MQCRFPQKNKRLLHYKFFICRRADLCGGCEGNPGYCTDSRLFTQRGEQFLTSRDSAA